MKKNLFIFSFLICTTVSFCQISEYTASNGVTYHVGDTITLLRGSGHNGEFVYCQMGDAFSTLSALNGQTSGINQGLPKNQAGANMIIKKIKETKIKGAKQTYFFVAGGNIVQYKIIIEDALSTGEIKSVGYTSDQALNELKKAKDKLDLQIINQNQYDSIKSVLMKFIK